MSDRVVLCEMCGIEFRNMGCEGLTLAIRLTEELDMLGERILGVGESEWEGCIVVEHVRVVDEQVEVR